MRSRRAWPATTFLRRCRRRQKPRCWNGSVRSWGGIARDRVSQTAAWLSRLQRDREGAFTTRPDDRSPRARARYDRSDEARSRGRHFATRRGGSRPDRSELRTARPYVGDAGEHPDPFGQSPQRQRQRQKRVRGGIETKTQARGGRRAPHAQAPPPQEGAESGFITGLTTHRHGGPGAKQRAAVRSQLQLVAGRRGFARRVDGSRLHPLGRVARDRRKQRISKANALPSARPGTDGRAFVRRLSHLAALGAGAVHPQPALAALHPARRPQRDGCAALDLTWTAGDVPAVRAGEAGCRDRAGRGALSRNVRESSGSLETAAHRRDSGAGNSQATGSWNLVGSARHLDRRALLRVT